MNKKAKLFEQLMRDYQEIKKDNEEFKTRFAIYDIKSGSGIIGEIADRILKKRHVDEISTLPTVIEEGEYLQYFRKYRNIDYHFPGNVNLTELLKNQSVENVFETQFLIGVDAVKRVMKGRRYLIQINKKFVADALLEEQAVTYLKTLDFLKKWAQYWFDEFGRLQLRKPSNCKIVIDACFKDLYENYF